MLKITRIVKRPDPNIKWFHETVTPVFLEYLNEKYIKSEKLTKTRTYDETGNIQTNVLIWVNDEAFEEFKNDPILTLIVDQRRTYEANNQFEIISQDIEII